MKTTKSKWLKALLIVALVLICCCVFVACNKDNPDVDDGTITTPPDDNQGQQIVDIGDGSEMGTYYYTDSTGTYTVVLSAAKKATVLLPEVNASGTYAVTANGVVFDLANAEKEVTAVLDGNTIKVTVDGSEMIFRKNVKYTVTYRTNGGSAVEDSTVVNGQTVVKPADPVRHGYKFLGWYNDREFTSPFLFDSQIVTGNVTVYARWVDISNSPREYVVSFDTNGGNVIADATTIGGCLFDVATPVREGYTFVGWGYSAYDRADKITTMYDEDMVFEANSTLFAQWASNDGTKLPSPAVKVTGKTITWEEIEGAQSYDYEVYNEVGVKIDALSGSVGQGQTSVNVDIQSMATGHYTVKVTAIASTASKNSEPTVRYYKNNALTPVSLFSIVEPSTLVFNDVGADEYFITIKCGNPNHNHTAMSIGKSTNYSFINCDMPVEGIEFTVTAKAKGMIDSVSRPFTFLRALDAISYLDVDQATETVKWSAVTNATNYIVTLTNGTTVVTVDVNGATSYSLNNYDAGMWTISVYPKTNGYVSGNVAEVIYNKESLSAPQNVHIEGLDIVWDAVNGASNYVVMVENKQFTVQNNSINIGDLVNDIVIATGGDYTVKVIANGTKPSGWSEATTFRYNAIFDSVNYNAGTISWTPVVGAEKYFVYVNDLAPVIIPATQNSVMVQLSQAGDNVISVSYTDGEEESARVSITVYAYSMTFDTRGGTAVDTAYYAIGDVIVLPTNTAKAGFDFNGWYNTPSGSAGNGAEYTSKVFNYSGDVILFADWTAQIYTVTYNYGEGVSEDMPASVKIAYNSNDFNLAVPQAADGIRSFVGWFTNANGGGIQLTDAVGNAIATWTIPGNSTIYAYFVTALKYNYDSVTQTYIVLGDYNARSSVSHIVVPQTYDDGEHGECAVSTVESKAFTGFTSLKTVEIPNTVTLINSIGDNSAFKDCSALENINIYDAGNIDSKYYSVDGVLYWKKESGENELLVFPRGKTGSFEIADNCVSIPLKAFQNTKIEYLYIPASVALISEQAFYYARNLKSVIFLDAEEGEEVQPLTIGNQAFYNNDSLTEITFPDRYTEYNATIFSYGCTSLANIFVSENNAALSSVDGMLCNKSGDTLLRYPTGRLGTFRIPAGVTKIGDEAFKRCTLLTEVSLPGWVVEVGTSAFENCSALTKVTFEESIDEVKIGKNAFYNDYKITSVVFDGRVSEIGKHAFYGCSALEEIVLPASLQKIDEYAFYRCSNLKSVVFAPEAEEGVELSIGDNAFFEASKLTEIYIPKYVTKISTGIFGGCTSLSGVIVDADNPSYSDIDGVLFDKAQEILIFFPYARGGVYEVPETVTTIGQGVFQSNVKLEGIILGENVVSIEQRAFKEAKSLKSVIAYGTEELELGGSAFYQCTLLETVDFNGRVKVYPEMAFTNTINLKSINLDGATYIGARAFASRDDSSGNDRGTGLVSVTIPITVTEISWKAFACNSKLKEVHFETIEEAEAAGKDVSNVQPLEFVQWVQVYETTGNTTTWAPGSVFNYCSALKYCNLPDRLAVIPTNAFTGCSELVSSGKETDIFYFPASVTSIGYGAFANCKALKNVVFLDDGRTDDNGNPLTLTFDKGTSSPSTTYSYFSGTSIESMVLPERMNVLADFALVGTKLKNITLPASLHDVGGTLGVGQQAFYYLTTLEEVTFLDPEEEVEGQVLTLGKQAFYYCSFLQKITLPNRLKAFTDGFANVFYGNKRLSSINISEDNLHFTTDSQGIIYNKDMTELQFCPTGYTGEMVIPNTVTVIANNAIKATGVTSITFEPNGTEDLTIGTVNNTFTYAIANNEKLVSMHLPARLKTLNYGALISNSNVKEIIFDDIDDSRLEVINQYAFANLYFLKGIKLPGSVKEIKNNAFNYAYNLKTVTFGTENSPSQLTTIGNQAFQKCGIKEIVLPDSITTLGTGLFTNGALETISIPSSLASIGNALDGALYFKSVTVRELDEQNIVLNSDGVIMDKDGTTIMKYVGNATEYTIPEGVTAISANAFRHNTTLKKVTIAASVASIGSYAFANTNIEEIEILGGDEPSATPLAFDNATGYTFAYNYSLNKINIPGRVHQFGKYTFYYSKVAQVTFGNNVRFTEIGQWAFRYTEIKSVEIPEGVTTLGAYAFGECASLESVTFPSTMTTLGAGAFNKTAIKEVDLSNTRITTIANSYVFQNCAELQKVTLPVNLTTISGASLFENDVKLEEVVRPEGSKLATISGKLAFGSCSSLKSFDFTGIKLISGESCFRLAGFTELTIKKEVTNLGAGAFAENPITKLTFEEGFTGATLGAGTACTTARPLASTGKGGIFEGLLITELHIPKSMTKFGTAMFAYNTKLTTVTFAAREAAFNVSVTDTFYGCSALTSIDLPYNSGTTMGDRMFGYCTSLETINLPGTITLFGTNGVAGTGVFVGCTELKEITSSATTANITTIGRGMCEGCTSLTSFPFDKLKNTATISYYAFRGCAFTEVEIDCKTIYTGAFNDNLYLERVAIGADIYNIIQNGPYDQLFTGCPLLSGGIEIAEGAKWLKVDEDAGIYYHGVTNSNGAVHHVMLGFMEDIEGTFTVPSHITSIQSYAFANTHVEEIIVPANVTFVATYAFANVPTLKRVVFESGSTISYMGSGITIAATAAVTLGGATATTSTYTFADSKALEEVVLPDSLLGIGGYMFQNCTSLKKVTFGDNITSIYNYAFQGCTGLTEVYIPEQITSVGTYVFAGCTSLTKAEFAKDSDLEYLGGTTLSASGYIFQGCTSLSEVILPSKLKNIPSYMFQGCTSLKSIDLPETVIYMGTYVFANSGITSIDLDGVANIGMHAFDGCEGLTEVELPASLGEAYLSGSSMSTGNIGTYLFYNCINLKKVIIDENIKIKQIPSFAFANCKKLTSVKIPASITAINNNAFEGCISLAIVDLSEAQNLGTIQKFAFADCDAITEMYIPETVYAMQEEVFSGMGKNVTIYFYAEEACFNWTAGWDNNCQAKFVFGYTDTAE